MRIVSFRAAGLDRLGLVDGDEVIDMNAIDPRLPADLGAILRETGGGLSHLGSIAARARASERRPLDGLEYDLPVRNPGKIVCLGLNYVAHAKEGVYSSVPLPEHPSLFLRSRSSLAPHEAAIERPLCSDKLDFEAELVAIIGRGVRHATPDTALQAVAGYACFNDGSLRDYQRRTTQWTMGKNFDRTGGFGPWMVTSDELPPGAAGLRIACRLNGATMQSDNTSNMIFSVAATIVSITEGMTLEPGDLVVMGTPSGVGYARAEPVFMKDGDVVEIEIEGIGTLRNPIRDEVADGSVEIRGAPHA
jgi:acylpyruvate hydrolase